MDTEELRNEIRQLLDPEPDPDWVGRDFPHSKITAVYGLDTQYLATTNWEGSTLHPRTRLCRTDAEPVHVLMRNYDVPTRLFESGLRLYADSLIAYNANLERTGQLRYYPPVILTVWSGFETFVRYSSELFLATTTGVASAISDFLQESETAVDRNGDMSRRPRYRPVLDRYVVLLKEAFGHRIDRGSQHWRSLEAARDLRHYYTHLDMKAPRNITAQEVTDYIEAVFLGIIWPSTSVKRTLLLGIYNLYWTWTSLRELPMEFTEQPFFKDWPIGDDAYHFYCPFDRVDVVRFPNGHELVADNALEKLKRKEK
jgi:hypothetical protein